MSKSEYDTLTIEQKARRDLLEAADRFADEADEAFGLGGLFQTWYEHDWTSDVEAAAFDEATRILEDEGAPLLMRPTAPFGDEAHVVVLSVEHAALALHAALERGAMTGSEAEAQAVTDAVTAAESASSRVAERAALKRSDDGDGRDWDPCAGECV